MNDPVGPGHRVGDGFWVGDVSLVLFDVRELPGVNESVAMFVGSKVE